MILDFRTFRSMGGRNTARRHVMLKPPLPPGAEDVALPVMGQSRIFVNGLYLFFLLFICLFI